ncbi:GTP pyrophosphokinase [Undibacterium sp. Ji83W]|uniref:GTP pyrophosphokinase n=1 Tax=Undibacterium sp. Ji83W TaxID=3413043 RepID=UPI003BF0F07F
MNTRILNQRFHSFKKKIAKDNKDYLTLSEITDLAGIRIITYLAKDVDLVQDIVDREFDVDEKNSPDKRIPDNPKMFGYSSLHKVVALNESRRDLAEYKNYFGLKCEIQIRSVLQHAWAEIEHDLGYKNSVGIPSVLQRRFSRVAGLLEIVDSEFDEISKKMQEYENSLPGKLADAQESVEINLVSLRVAYNERSALRDLDLAIANALNIPVSLTSNSFDSIVLASGVCEIMSIEKLENLARIYKDQIVRFARNVDIKNVTMLNIGQGLMYLMYFLLASGKDEDRSISLLIAMGGSSENASLIYARMVSSALLV